MKVQTKRWKKTIMGIVMAVVMFVTTIITNETLVHAQTLRVGTVTADSLNFRTGPGTTYPRIVYIYYGDCGTVLGESRATDGTVWYNMNIAGVVGWASSEYINVTEVIVKTDTSFENYMNQQGFPESYKPQLRVLHQKYPNWKFQAQHTNLSWGEVISAESIVGVNLVHTNSIASWKSMHEDAYDKETGTWKGFDSDSWVAASEDIVKTYMDPRNFLDETYIFQFLMHKYNPSRLTVEEKSRLETGLHSMVQGTFLAGNCEGKSYEQVIFDAANSSGVDPCVLAAMILQEQGSPGNGKSISGIVPGYENFYNYFNIRSYPSGGYTAVQYGLLYAKGSGDFGRPWNTRTKSILGGASYYGTHYVEKGQDTIYLKKFNVQGANPYKHQYMTNIQGAASEGRILSRSYNTVSRQASLVFKIPVYMNMPSEACLAPTGSEKPSGSMQSFLNSSAYSVNQNARIITGIVSFPITAEDFRKNITLTQTGDILIEKSNGQVNTGVIGTGDAIKVRDSSEIVQATYNVIIYGDVNGDGKIQATDYRALKNQIMNDSQILTGYFRQAADIDRNGKIQAVDYMAIKNHIMEKSTIQQR